MVDTQGGSGGSFNRTQLADVELGFKCNIPALVGARGISIVTVYLLYYAGWEEDVGKYLVWVHASLGFSFPFLLAIHIVSGEKTRTIAPPVPNCLIYCRRCDNISDSLGFAAAMVWSSISRRTNGCPAILFRTVENYVSHAPDAEDPEDCLWRTRWWVVVIAPASIQIRFDDAVWSAERLPNLIAADPLPDHLANLIFFEGWQIARSQGVHPAPDYSPQN